ncbi:MAG: hypothetical protein HEQ23_09535 [Tepidisphaera sp.]
MSTPDMSKPNSFDLSLDLAPYEPLTPSARDARDAMLEPLRTRVVARRRRRLAIRGGSACVLAITTIVGVQLLTTPNSTPSREIVQQTPPPAPIAPEAPAAPEVTVERPKKFAITILTTDPTVLDRLSAKPPAAPLITSLTDDELLDALQAAGTPGFIKINGKVVLSRDLFKPAESDANPQSRGETTGDTHG